MADFLLKRMSRNIVILRKRMGLTQEKLAEKAGLSTRYLSRIETASANPTIEVLAPIAKALNTSIDDLIYRDDDPQTKPKTDRSV